jgi:hypothetical protein
MRATKVSLWPRETRTKHPPENPERFSALIEGQGYYCEASAESWPCLNEVSQEAKSRKMELFDSHRIPKSKFWESSSVKLIANSLI